MNDDILKELEESARLGAEALKSGDHIDFIYYVLPDRISRWREAFEAQAEELRLLRELETEVSATFPPDHYGFRSYKSLMEEISALRARQQKGND